MGYKYQGDAIINASLTVNTPKPLDARSVVEDINELYSIKESNAYQGMTVANINDGNLYMLIDKSKIKEKAGWKASYESIQIVTCTQEEYDEWAANTTEDFKPIDDNLTYLRRDVYYYIYENEDSSQYYVTKKQIEDWLDAKASASAVDGLGKQFNAHVTKYEQDLAEVHTTIENLVLDFNGQGYITSEQIAQTYATKESLKETDNKFTNYYTSEKIDELFVTKESLRGGLEGNDDFVFVTQNQYNTDKESQATKFTTQELVIGESSITTNATELLLNTKPVAFKEEVPKIEMLSKKEYDNLETPDSDTYYYLYDDDIVGYITHNTALDTFYTKTQINNMIATAKLEVIEQIFNEYITPLQNRIAELENSQS